MTSSYHTALQTARLATADQNNPKACLYMVATPIGNLADISLRALHILELADFIACEDTRHTSQLLQKYEINKTSKQLIALHQHNEREAALKVIELLQSNLRIAYVSDAGTPGVSDPGAILAQEVQNAGFRIIPIPGASSVTAALSAAALVTHNHNQSQPYLFVGFLPIKAKARRDALEALQQQTTAIILLEAPHRILNLAQDLALFKQRKVTLARELTKQHEQITCLPANELANWLSADAQRTRGEFVVIIHALEAETESESMIPAPTKKLLELLLNEPTLSLKSAVQIASQTSDIAKNSLYEWALKWQQQNKTNEETTSEQEGN